MSCWDGDREELPEEQREALTMADQEDEGDVNDSDGDAGVAERILQGAPPPPVLPAAAADHRDACRRSAEETWAVILASLEPEARRQERATAAYLAAQLGVRL